MEAVLHRELLLHLLHGLHKAVSLIPIPPTVRERNATAAVLHRTHCCSIGVGFHILLYGLGALLSNSQILGFLNSGKVLRVWRYNLAKRHHGPHSDKKKQKQQEQHQTNPSLLREIDTDPDQAR